MIPKIIHYCWFGRNPLPESAIMCINSWKKFFPDYEIKEWNEDNFDVNIIPYTQEAYDSKKYAFVSDYARFWILYHFGGVYFDTDVEVIKPMDDIIARGAFMGVETPAIEGEKVPRVAPGLGIAAEAGTDFYKGLLDYYTPLHFVDADGNLNQTTIVEHTTKVLVKAGLKSNNDIQQVADLWVYPVDYFNPFDDTTGKLNKTANTRSIHWYSKTWMDKKLVRRNKITRIIHRFFGVNSLQWLKKLLRHK